MGNIPLAIPRGDKYCLQVELGDEPADISFHRNRQHNGKIYEVWQMSMPTCGYTLTKITEGKSKSPPHHVHPELYIQYSDEDFEFSVTVQRDKAGLLHPTCNLDVCGAVHNVNSRTTNPSGGITDTMMFEMRGRGTRMGLMIFEWKRRSKNEEPYMGTARHYFAATRNEKDVGVSVAVKNIKASNDGHMDFAVDSPEQNPAAALFYMFNEVRRTNTWKSTYCPHCANNFIQRHCLSCQFDSEASDKDNSVPIALANGRKQKAPTGGRIADNRGVFIGENPGAVYIRLLKVECKDT